MTRTPPTPRWGEIGQSALMGAVAAGVLQGGLELPGAISNAASDIRTTRRAIGSNEDIARRATANIQAVQNPSRISCICYTFTYRIHKAAVSFIAALF